MFLSPWWDKLWVRSFTETYNLQVVEFQKWIDVFTGWCWALISALTRLMLGINFSLYWTIVHTAVVRCSCGFSPWVWYSFWKLLEKFKVSQFLPKWSRHSFRNNFLYASPNSPRILLHSACLFHFRMPYFSSYLKLDLEHVCLQTPRI